MSYEAMYEESHRCAGSINLSIDLVAHFSSVAVNACNLLIDGQGREEVELKMMWKWQLKNVSISSWR